MTTEAVFGHRCGVFCTENVHVGYLFVSSYTVAHSYCAQLLRSYGARLLSSFEMRAEEENVTIFHVFRPEYFRYIPPEAQRLAVIYVGP